MSSRAPYGSIRRHSSFRLPSGPLLDARRSPVLPRPPARARSGARDARPSSAASSCARLNSQCTSASHVKPMPPCAWIAEPVTSTPGRRRPPRWPCRPPRPAARARRRPPRRRSTWPSARPRCAAASARSGARPPGTSRRARRTACARSRRRRVMSSARWQTPTSSAATAARGAVRARPRRRRRAPARRRATRA